jgi:hypothetical protein
MKISSKHIILLIGALCSWPALAETPEEKGLAIAQEADRRDRGFQDNTASVRMILKNQQGESSERQIQIRALENPQDGEGDKSFMLFLSPLDIQNTALLTYTHIKEADDQWLYLPALKRVKRITTSNKSGPFVGSEFAYEDMTSPEVAKYTYKYLRDEPCGELNCFVVERYPAYENSGYSKQIFWIDQSEYRFHKIEFYDHKDALLKKLTLRDYHQYLDKHWRPHDMLMENQQTGKSTQMLWTDYRFRTGLKESDFSQNALLQNP